MGRVMLAPPDDRVAKNARTANAGIQSPPKWINFRVCGQNAVLQSYRESYRDNSSATRMLLTTSWGLGMQRLDQKTVQIFRRVSDGRRTYLPMDRIFAKICVVRRRLLDSSAQMTLRELEHHEVTLRSPHSRFIRKTRHFLVQLLRRESRR